MYAAGGVPALALSRGAWCGHWLTDGLVRVPLLSGSRMVFVPVHDDDVVVLPPPPPEHVVDTGAAVRDALRFPLSGPPLSELAPRGGRATVVVEPPELPLPGAQLDPRQEALAATIDELARAGIPDDRVTVLVAGGLGRRLARRELDWLLEPPRARSFRGRVLVHDATAPDLRPLVTGGREARVSRALVETNLVVVLTAAETVLHGGPAALLGAADPATARRSAAAGSLLRLSGSAEWDLLTALESEVAARVPLVGISLVLDLPRLLGTFRAYPHDPDSFQHARRSPFRRIHSRLPGSIRRRILTDLTRSVATTGVYAGPPSVAHAEALLRGVELRAARLPEPVDALVLGVPWIGPHYPREPLNPITSAALTLGLELRLWRDAFPVRPGGTLVLVHTLRRSFAHGHEDPYRAMFETVLSGDREAVALAERRAASDERLLTGYRAGRTSHPLLPYADWAGCLPALSRLGQVVIAGSRDAAAARALGFVPTHSLASALDMAHGVAGGRARLGVVVAPPYAPLLVGGV